MASRFAHTPVLLQECIAAWIPAPAHLARMARPLFVDCTVGGGGHSTALLEACPRASLLCLDRDQDAVRAATKRLSSTGRDVTVLHSSYVDVAQHVRKHTAQGGYEVAGIMADLGVSSFQLDTASRGFSFTHSGPLDMRFDASTTDAPTAADLVGALSEAELTDVLQRYGDVPAAPRIAAAIVRERAHKRIADTRTLAELVAAAMPRQFWKPGRHPATGVFQALRIAVNGEMAAVSSLCVCVPALLHAGGRFVAIAFHSLEHDTVIAAMRMATRQRSVQSQGARHGADGTSSDRRLASATHTRDGTHTHVRTDDGEPAWRMRLVEKCVRPSAEESQRNPRARSARMSVWERC